MVKTLTHLKTHSPVALSSWMKSLFLCHQPFLHSVGSALKYRRWVTLLFLRDSTISLDHPFSDGDEPWKQACEMDPFPHWTVVRDHPAAGKVHRCRVLPSLCSACDAVFAFWTRGALFFWGVAPVSQHPALWTRSFKCGLLFLFSTKAWVYTHTQWIFSWVSAQFLAGFLKSAFLNAYFACYMVF